MIVFFIDIICKLFHNSLICVFLHSNIPSSVREHYYKPSLPTNLCLSRNFLCSRLSYKRYSIDTRRKKKNYVLDSYRVDNGRKLKVHLKRKQEEEEAKKYIYEFATHIDTFNKKNEAVTRGYGRSLNSSK